MRFIRSWRLGVLAVACCRAGSVAATTGPSRDLTQVAEQGRKIDAKQAARLEDASRADPGDAYTRASLLGFYSLRPGDDRQRRLRHVLWMVLNNPTDAFAASGYCALDPGSDADGYAQAKAIWTKHLSAQPDDLRILRNASTFFLPSDDAMAEQLLAHAAELAPKDTEWPERLALLYERRASRSREGRAKAAGQALAQRLHACYLSGEALPRFRLFIEAPRDAVRAGDFIQAKKLAQQLVNTAAVFRDDPDFGWAMHIANIVFGRVALHTGDVDTANTFLIAAGEVATSPRLAASGPDMSLAKELLGHGQRRMVRDFLVSCERLWPAGSARLKAWQSSVAENGKAEFGAQAIE